MSYGVSGKPNTLRVIPGRRYRCANGQEVTITGETKDREGRTIPGYFESPDAPDELWYERGVSVYRAEWDLVEEVG